MATETVFQWLALGKGDPAGGPPSVRVIQDYERNKQWLAGENME